MKQKPSSHSYTNALIHESSPYLLQHAHNPVNWHAWNDTSLQKAQQEKKLILVSIGYSACHWCHVMEQESFEDLEVAALMNRYFICIKVDREERPDVDKMYMDAVQLVSGRGGWPLNCFALPDGRPVWGGTYFPKEEWIKVLQKIQQLYETEGVKLEEQAVQLVAGLVKYGMAGIGRKPGRISRDVVEKFYLNLRESFDTEQGGSKGAPKFPMPVHLHFLMQYAWYTKDIRAQKQLELSLDKMAMGGIYDQIGGGFARYSVDARWHVPHFEKMLYDNAQLIALYADAWRFTQKPLYRRVVEQSLEFIERELAAGQGAYYSALDADSEGEEGRFYVWTETEFDQLFGSDATLYKAWFGVGKAALWEQGKNVLVSPVEIGVFADKWELDEAELRRKTEAARSVLLAAREKRARPGLDDKILTAWNALMIKAWVGACKAFKEQKYLLKAQQTAKFLLENLMAADGSLYRSYKNEQARIVAFLDDYVLLADALLALFEVDPQEKWLDAARGLADISIRLFSDEENGLFFYTAKGHSHLAVRQYETTDQVIPSSNAVMAGVLMRLGQLLDRPAYSLRAKKEVQRMVDQAVAAPSAFCQWGVLLLSYIHSQYVLTLTGPRAKEFSQELLAAYQPNAYLLFAEKEAALSYFENRFVDGETLFYVCEGTACKIPVRTVGEALLQMAPKR